MNKDEIKKLLHDLYERKIEPAKALKSLQNLPYENMGFASIDHHRDIRQGFPEVIYCEGKTNEQVLQIVQCMIKNGNRILCTRASDSLFNQIKKIDKKAKFNKDARTIIVQDKPIKPQGKVAIVTAGTSDIPVAEEAAETAMVMGSSVDRLFDVGVAGIHRILDNRELLSTARVVVVAAGMDGALASVVGGLVAVPVIALPTSVGYGASFQGLSALLAMLNSCASGVGVVNIDNGYGAGCLAHKINTLKALEQ